MGNFEPPIGVGGCRIEQAYALVHSLPAGRDAHFDFGSGFSLMEDSTGQGTTSVHRNLVILAPGETDGLSRETRGGDVPGDGIDRHCGSNREVARVVRGDGGIGNSITAHA